MSDALPLPPRPHLEQYRKLAEELRDAGGSPDPEAVRRWAAGWSESLERRRGDPSTDEARGEIESLTQRISGHWRQFQERRGGAAVALGDAQFFIARSHGFESWPRFTHHLEALTRAGSLVSAFEAAADAIVAGDLATLRRLLAANPHLAHARSTREHRSTLLHYVSANGVEDFRQRTPRNIVEIAKLLLEAGVDANAESEVYGGGATTLGLAATSVHPEAADLQVPLLQLLIEHGARIDPPAPGSTVRDCLANGRGPAAEYLATRGARIGLAEAAGIGRLDIARSFFDADGSLRPPATRAQLDEALAWGCQFGRAPVVEFLLAHGADAGARLAPFGQAALHWAAYGGHVPIVSALLGRGALVDVKDERYGGTPLEWALYQWGNGQVGGNPDRYQDVVRALARAGAKLDPLWAGQDRERNRAIERLRSDPRMLAALGS